MRRFENKRVYLISHLFLYLLFDNRGTPLECLLLVKANIYCTSVPGRPSPAQSPYSLLIRIHVHRKVILPVCTHVAQNTLVIPTLAAKEIRPVSTKKGIQNGRYNEWGIILFCNLCFSRLGENGVNVPANSIHAYNTKGKAKRSWFPVFVRMFWWWELLRRKDPCNLFSLFSLYMEMLYWINFQHKSC